MDKSSTSKPSSVHPYKTKNLKDLYHIGKELGTGQSGTTYLCTEISTGTQYACKSILKTTFRNEKDYENVWNEIKIMHHLSDVPNVVRIKATYEDSVSVHLVMELCPGGELFYQIEKKAHCPERKAAQIIKKIVQVVGNCHSLGVIHGDIKPENFLFSSADEDAALKAINFGSSLFHKTETTPGTGTSSASLPTSDTNEGYEVKEVSRAQMEVQRKLHLLVEVEKHVQIRKDAERRYIDSMLERACKMLADQTMGDAVAVTGGQDLALATKASATISTNDPMGFYSVSPTEAVRVHVPKEEPRSLQHPQRAADCSTKSFLTSPGSLAALSWEMSPPGRKKSWDTFSNPVGSPYYVAPEVLKKNYGPESDVWSAGIVLYHLLSGVTPFSAAKDLDSILKQIVEEKIEFESEPWPEISENAKDLTRKMLVRNPKERLTVHQVLCHPWIVDDGVPPDKPLDSAVLSRLKRFSTMNKLKKIATRLIAERLKEEEIAGLKELFKMIDTDNSGTITFDELKDGLKKVGSELKDPEIKDLMDGADINNNGTIESSEFLAATLHLNKMEREENLMSAFSFFDKDDNGYITMDELQHACGKLGLSDIHMDEVIREIDQNNDVQIDYAEFSAMMREGNGGEP